MVICDSFKNPNAPLYEIYKDTGTLIHHAPRKENRVGYHPTFQSIRWQNFYLCVKFINHNQQGYLNSEDKTIRDLYSKHPWKTIQTILFILQSFLVRIETDLGTIADIISSYYFAEQQLVLLSYNHNMATIVLEKMRTRFMLTCPLLLPWSAFLFTHDGLKYYRDNAIEQTPLFAEIKKALALYMTERGFADD